MGRYGRRRRYEYGYSRWAPYVPVAARRREAHAELQKLTKTGLTVRPVVIEGRTIASTFWGKAWCDNMESYSDFDNRLPRGRTYLRNGSVVHLDITEGRVDAYVSGSDLYTVRVNITPVAKREWQRLVGDCTGAVGSAVDLLAGRLSKGVMGRLARCDNGLFPQPKDIEFECSCPDWAYMCKHVAAVMYGVGARLDTAPELLFKLRGVDYLDLVTAAAVGVGTMVEAERPADALGDEGLAELFGIELGGEAVEPPPPPKRRGRPAATNPDDEKRKKQTSSRGRRADNPGKLPQRKQWAPAAPRIGSTVTSADLLALGLPRSTFQNWVTEGSLEQTGTRGAYRVSKRAKERISVALRRLKN